MQTAALRQFNSRRQYWKRNIGFWVLGLLICTFLMAVLSEFGYQRNFERLYLQTRLNAENELENQTLLLESYLEKYRLLPVLLARQSRTVDDLALGNLSSLKPWLQQLSYLSGSHDVMLLSTSGDILLSARYDSDYYPDFSETELVIAPGQARLGRLYLHTNQDSQLYGFSTQINLASSGTFIFVFVVNLELVKQSWALSSSHIVAIDRSEKVTLTNNTNVTDAQAIEQYLKNPEYVTVQKDVNSMGWKVFAFQRLDLAALRERTILAGLLISLAMVSSIAFFIRRREKGLKQAFSDRLYAKELEEQINFRTAELVSSNRYLSDEINERKLAEKHLKLKHNELIHSAKLATIGQMSATLSHEYNQPLAATRTYAENALRFLQMGRVEPVKENLERILVQSDRMGQLSKTLLSFAGKPNQPMSAIDACAAIGEAVMLVNPRLTRAQVSLEKTIEQGVLLKGHAMQFCQVLVNLLTNAADAVCGNEPNSRHVRISVSAGDSMALISVEDNGTGIAKSVEKTLFEPFSSSKTSGQGLGLGLSIIRDIVNDHQGTISYTKSDMGGVCFQIEWPLWQQETGKPI